MTQDRSLESRITRVAEQLRLKTQQVQAALELLEAGNTVPFVTRYRKEVTGGLDEEQLRSILEAETRLRQLEDRRASIRNSLEERQLLTPQMQQALDACSSLTDLEDFYLPYRPRRRTRAGDARQKGLAPLAGLLLQAGRGRRGIPESFLVIQNEDNQLLPHPDPAAWLTLAGLSREAVIARLPELLPELPFEEQLAGAGDIVAEWLSEEAVLRASIRTRAARGLRLVTRLKPKHPDAPRFRSYDDHSEALGSMPPHRVLAVNRGEALGCLQVKAAWDELPLEEMAARHIGLLADSPWREELLEALRDGLKRLIQPSLERELRAARTEVAENHSLELYDSNLRQLLLQAPMPGKVMLGLDPGFRTGCKIAVVDGTGRYLEGGTIYPHPPQNRQLESRQELLRLARKHHVEVIAIGNGTASRESQELVAEFIRENNLEIRFAVVDEAGASVYSASEEAREEFPELEASLRGNISIARRLQDPLAELVKIDPRSLGVGQYQHDVDQRRLGERLDGVVESCVNQVGVDLNTASASLLRRVSGLTRRTSRNIVAWREDKGRFRRREELREVDGIGPAAFLQSAGFLRIRDGEEALDNTGVHPERYPVLKSLFARFSIDPNLPRDLAVAIRRQHGSEADLAELAAELDLGLPTLQDILRELEKPGRDPRAELEAPVLREALPEMKDLEAGQVLEGVVRNLTDFGAFVDLGMKQDGLLHVSQISRQRVRHPLDKLALGQKIRVQVLDVDLERGRISLSMKALEAPSPAGNRNRDRRDSRPAPASEASIGSRIGTFSDRAGRDQGRKGKRP